MIFGVDSRQSASLASPLNIPLSDYNIIFVISFAWNRLPTLHERSGVDLHFLSHQQHRRRISWPESTSA